MSKQHGMFSCLDPVFHAGGGEPEKKGEERLSLLREGETTQTFDESVCWLLNLGLEYCQTPK